MRFAMAPHRSWARPPQGALEGPDQACHAAPKRADALAQVSLWHLEAKEGGGLPRSQDAQPGVAEAVGLADRLAHQFVRHAQVGGQRGDRLAAEHEAFGAALDREAGRELCPNLSAE